MILNKLSEALHCAGDSGDSIAPCLVYMRTKVRTGECDIRGHDCIQDGSILGSDLTTK